MAQTHQLVDTLEQIQFIADSYQSKPKGNLRITAPIFLGQQYIQTAVSRFMKRYPDVRIILSMDDRKADIIADHFDLAFRVSKLSESNMIAKKLANTNFAIIASKEFIRKHGIPQTPEQLIALPAVVYGNMDVTLDQIKIGIAPHCPELKVHKMKGNYKVSDVRAIVDAVKDGLGYTIVDLFNLHRPIDELGLVPLLTNYVLSNLDTGIYAIYPHRKKTLLVTEFIKTVQDVIGQPPVWEQYIPNYSELYK